MINRLMKIIAIKCSINNVCGHTLYRACLQVCAESPRVKHLTTTTKHKCLP